MNNKIHLFHCTFYVSWSSRYRSTSTSIGHHWCSAYRWKVWRLLYFICHLLLVLEDMPKPNPISNIFESEEGHLRTTTNIASIFSRARLYPSWWKQHWYCYHPKDGNVINIVTIPKDGNDMHYIATRTTLILLRIQWWKRH